VMDSVFTTPKLVSTLQQLKHTGTRFYIYCQRAHGDINAVLEINACVVALP
jgi:hypothetical protein